MSEFGIGIWFLYHLLIPLFLFFPYVTDGNESVTKIGVIIDTNSTVGQQMKTAMELALVKNHNLSLHFQHPPNNPLQSAKAAERLIKEIGVKVIIGIERWEEAALVTDVANQARIPFISFAQPPISTTRWPFLVTMAYSDFDQMKCISEIISNYNWRQVVTIQEDYGYGGDSAEFSALSQALQNVNSQIEHRLVLPPFSSLSDPSEDVKEELEKLQQVQSRVFIVLRMSFSLAIHLFKEAQKMGFTGKDTVWILIDTVTGFLDSFDTSVIYSIEGAVGIKTYYSDNTTAYKNFYSEFKRKFRVDHPEEDNFVQTIANAITRNKTNLLDSILSSNFSGLSGRIHFKAGKPLQNPKLKLVNVVGKKYKEIDFWSANSGFENPNNMGPEGPVIWPGDLKRVPKGWEMPSNEKPMIIGVPGRTSFEKFVKVVNATENRYDGFCIELFYMVLQTLDYDIPYKFVPYNGTYGDLVTHVYNKTFDAIVGDVTILAERWERVEFTQPYAESGLSMIVPVKMEESSWMFMKPFTWEMWVVTGSILIYTMFIVWFLEHQHNPEFRGPWKDQIGTAVLFTFSSLFFAHREKIYSNLTRLVLVVWLFVVLILNSSYTANLTSMLTVQRLQPNVTEIDWLKRNNLPVGCDGDSFVRNYLENVLKFKPENIKNVSSEYAYPGDFQSKRIYAAFLELPYQKVFIDHYCKQYIANTPTYRFGGLGFAFQKGSPIAGDFSRAILELSEDGKLKNLEEKWFSASSKCEENGTEGSTESLSVKSFMGLFVISGATSTICFLIFVAQLLKKFRVYEKEEEHGNENVWKKTVNLAKYFYIGEPRRSPDVYICESPRWDFASSSVTPERTSSYSLAEVEVVNIPRDSGNQQGSQLVDVPDSDHHPE